MDEPGNAAHAADAVARVSSSFESSFDGLLPWDKDITVNVPFQDTYDVYVNRDTPHPNMAYSATSRRQIYFNPSYGPTWGSPSGPHVGNIASVLGHELIHQLRSDLGLAPSELASYAWQYLNADTLGSSANLNAHVEEELASLCGCK